MLKGPAVDSTRAFAEAVQRPVIASGGVGTLDHVRELAQLPVEGIIIGRALYAGTVSLPEAVGVVRTAR
jgi:phosphoribosylformimino-5-aminoimidazole carboxamide ribotide isomerase